MFSVTIKPENTCRKDSSLDQSFRKSLLGCTEILANHEAFCLMTRDGRCSDEFITGHLHICPFRPRCALGYEEHACEAQDVVDPQCAGMAHISLQDIAPVRKTML